MCRKCERLRTRSYAIHNNSLLQLVGIDSSGCFAKATWLLAMEPWRLFLTCHGQCLSGFVVKGPLKGSLGGLGGGGKHAWQQKYATGKKKVLSPAPGLRTSRAAARVEVAPAGPVKIGAVGSGGIEVMVCGGIACALAKYLEFTKFLIGAVGGGAILGFHVQQCGKNRRSGGGGNGSDGF